MYGNVLGRAKKKKPRRKPREQKPGSPDLSTMTGKPTINKNARKQLEAIGYIEKPSTSSR